MKLQTTVSWVSGHISKKGKTKKLGGEYPAFYGVAQMDIKNSIPMRLLTAEKIKFPSFFKLIDKAYKDSKAIWDKSYCYCPVAFAMAYLMELDDVMEPNLTYAGNGSKLAVISSWRVAKSIYDIDENLANEFLEQAKDDIKITSDMLALPSWCIYLNLPYFKGFSGLFVMFDHDVNRGRKELYVLPVKENLQYLPPAYLTIPEKAKSLSDIINEQYKESEQELTDKNIEGIRPGDKGIKEYFSSSKFLIRFVISILMYLSAVNAEVVLKNSKSYKRDAKIKDVPREVKVLSVGEKTGYKIRTLRKTVVTYNKGLGTGHHRSPMMHVRRAHYHTFLYGKGRTMKKLKWLPPVIVNANGDEIDTVTITKVERHRDD